MEWIIRHLMKWIGNQVRKEIARQLVKGRRGQLMKQIKKQAIRMLYYSSLLWAHYMGETDGDEVQVIGPIGFNDLTLRTCNRAN
jgi:hypothetical protein